MLPALAGVPSWMLVLLNNVLETTGKQNLHEVWPNLEVYFHGGVSFTPYKRSVQKKYYLKTTSSITKFIMLRKAFLLFKIKIIQVSYY